jgi:restriction endonuclease S subunit
MLPEGWSESPLDKLTTKERTICYGVVQPGEHDPNGVHFIRGGDIHDGKISSLLRTISKEVSAQYKRTLLEGGELLIALVGYIGETAIVPKSLAGSNIARQVGLISLGKHVHHEYVHQYLRSPCGKERLLHSTIGSAQQVINIADLKKVSITLPPLPEQQKIAAILSTWDRAIELTEKLIAAKQKRKQALMQQLLTGKVRFKRFVKSTETFSTRYGNYPKDWKCVRLEKVATEVSERNADGTDHQVLSCTKYHGLVDSLTYFGKKIFSDDLSTYKLVRRNHFAYATNHIEEGSIGYQNVCDVAVISPMYTVFKTKDGVDDGFLYKLLKSDLYVHIYQINTSASVDRRGSLRWDAFSHIRIALPAIDEQRAIAAVLDRQQQEIDVQKRKYGMLKQQKKGLMQQLLTGRIRVKVEHG